MGSCHNPKWCWVYHTTAEWMQRAGELGRCGECLTLFKTDATQCTNCHTNRVYWKPGDLNNGKKQTEENSNIIQKCKSKLQEKDTIIEELKNKITALEINLKSSNAAINELNWKWKNTLQEKKKS